MTGDVDVLSRGEEKLSEQALTDPNRFPWMNGYALGEVVPGSSGHFEEHEETIRA